MVAAASRSPIRPAPALALGFVLVVLGASVPAVGSPLPLLALSVLLAVTAGAIYVWGAEAPLLAALVITPLVPNSTGGFGADLLGAHAGDVRAALLLFLLGTFLACFPRGIPRIPRVLTGVVGALIAMAGAGLFAAAINAGTPGDALTELSHGVGQPLTYALLILAVTACLESREGARERVLAAVCVAILGQALVVAVEFGTGAAYDPVRGITRAQGTVGANFLSAMAMLGFFAGLSLRSGASLRRFRLLGIATAVVTLGVLTVATTRGGLVGVVIGVAYVFLTGVDARARLAIIATGIALLSAALLIPPVSSLWTERIQEKGGGIGGFDRASTWISGERMGADDPLSGLGLQGVEQGVATTPRYRETPAGHTSVVPHNIWILAFAEGGIANLLASLAFTGFVALAIWRRPRRSSLPDRFLVGGLLALAAVSVINNLFTHPEVMLPGIVLLTVMAGRMAAARERPEPAGAPRGLRPRGLIPRNHLPNGPPRPAPAPRG